MNGAVVFIIGLIAGIIGGVVVSLIVDEVNLNRVLEEFKNYHTGYYKNICKELNECLEKMDDNHAIDIADLHNDIEKTIWLDDLTIKGLQDQVNELKHIVDEHMRWSLGIWNDISHMDTTEIREKLGVPEERLPDNPDTWAFNCMGPLNRERHEENRDANDRE